MRVENRLKAPPPPVSPERPENRPAPPAKREEAVKPPEKPQADKPKDLGRSIDIQG